MRHNLSSLNIPGTFYSPPPLTPATVGKVGSVRVGLLAVILMLESAANEGSLPLSVAQDKLEEILKQVKLINSRMHTTQPNDMTYSPSRVSVIT